MNTNYGKTINFTFDGIKSAQSSLNNLRKLVNEHKNSENRIEQEKLDKYKADFLDAINDNLNTPLALGIMFSMLKNEPKSRDIYNLAIDFDRVFGLKLDEEQVVEIPADIKDLAEKRWQAKKNRDWATADKLRDEILSQGYQILDTKDGYEIKK